jgi:hypothetical protein
MRLPHTIASAGSIDLAEERSVPREALDSRKHDALEIVARLPTQVDSLLHDVQQRPRSGSFDIAELVAEERGAEFAQRSLQ